MVLEKREAMAWCGGMHDADQKACEPGETVAQNSFTETNRFPFPTWAVQLSHLFFWILFSLF
jgi:hypothetical protein